MGRKKKTVNPVWERWKREMDKYDDLIDQTNAMDAYRAQSWVDGQVKHYVKLQTELESKEPAKYLDD